jgi:hypothetical protein
VETLAADGTGDRVVCRNLLGVLLCIVLIVLRCGDIISWNWFLVFTPFYCAFFLFLISPCYFRWRMFVTDSGLGAYCGFLVVGAPTFIFSVLLPLYLEGRSPGDLTLAKVFAPFFVLDGFLLCASFVGRGVLSVWGGSSVRISCQQIDNALFVGSFIYSLAFSPLAIFNILLSLKIDSPGRTSRGRRSSSLSTSAPCHSSLRRPGFGRIGREEEEELVGQDRRSTQE